MTSPKEPRGRSVKSFSDTAREFYGDHYEEFAAMGQLRMSVRARAHRALLGRTQCAPFEPHPDAHADAPELRHDWLCDAVSETIEEDRQAGGWPETPAPDAPGLRFSCDNCHGADLPTLSCRAHGKGQEDGRRDAMATVSALTDLLAEAEELLSTWHLGAGCDPLNGMVDTDTSTFLALLGATLCRCGHPRSEHINGFGKVADCGRELDGGFCACAQFRPVATEPKP